MPFAVNAYLALAPTGDKGGLGLQLQIIFISNTFALLAITYLIFVPWKSGPDWYMKISPFLFYSSVYINYIILPVINILLTIFFALNPKFDLKVLPLESWVIFVTIVVSVALSSITHRSRRQCSTMQEFFLQPDDSRLKAKKSQSLKRILKRLESSKKC